MRILHHSTSLCVNPFVRAYLPMFRKLQWNRMGLVANKVKRTRDKELKDATDGDDKESRNVVVIIFL